MPGLTCRVHPRAGASARASCRGSFRRGGAATAACRAWSSCSYPTTSCPAPCPPPGPASPPCRTCARPRSLIRAPPEALVFDTMTNAIVCEVAPPVHTALIASAESTRCTLHQLPAWAVGTCAAAGPQCRRPVVNFLHPVVNPVSFLHPVQVAATAEQAAVRRPAIWPELHGVRDRRLHL